MAEDEVKPGVPPPGLISVDETIDAIGTAALEEARRREALKKALRDAALGQPPPAKRP